MEDIKGTLKELKEHFTSEELATAKVFPNNVTKLCVHSALKYIQFKKKHAGCYWKPNEEGEVPEDWDSCCFGEPTLIFYMSSIGASPYAKCLYCEEEESLFCSEDSNA